MRTNNIRLLIASMGPCLIMTSFGCYVAIETKTDHGIFWLMQGFAAGQAFCFGVKFFKDHKEN